MNRPVAKVFIRHSLTGCYLGRDGGWVDRCEEALEFSTLQDAGRLARERHLESRIVLRYENPVCELAVNPSFCV